MPTVSPAQHRLMEAAAHTKGGYGGVPQSVGKEFVGKDEDDVEAADEWSDEAREAAIKARQAHTHGNHKPSKSWSEAITNKSLKSDEIAGANAKELFQLRKKISEVEKTGDHEGLAHLKAMYEHVQATGKAEHESRPSHGTWAYGSGHKDRPVHDAAIAFDRSSARSYDPDGRLHVETTNISKSNICGYLGREIPDYQRLGLDGDRTYKLYRDPNELAKAAETFNNIPLLSRHVPVSAEDHQPRLVVGSTGTDAAFDGTYLKNSLVVWAKDAIDDIEADDKKELSCAYRYKAIMEPGSCNGESYDGRMTDIVGNHVALVSEGRAGSDVCVGDSTIELQWGRLVNALLRL